MKFCIGIILFCVALMTLFIIADHQCLVDDKKAVRVLHPEWSESQVDAQASLIHKGHAMRSGGGNYQ